MLSSLLMIAVFIFIDILVVKFIVSKMVTDIGWGRAIIVAILMVIVTIIISFVSIFAFLFIILPLISFAGGLIGIVVVVLLTFILLIFTYIAPVKIVISMSVEHISWGKAFIIALLFTIINVGINLLFTYALGLELFTNPLDSLPI